MGMKPRLGPTVRSPGDAYKFFSRLLGDKTLRQETSMVLSISGTRRLLGSHVVGLGAHTRVTFSLRDVARVALEDNATRVYLSHTHPPGGTTPSKPDLRNLWRASLLLKSLEIEVIDEIIIDHSGFMSVKNYLGGPPERPLGAALQEHFIAYGIENGV